MQTLKLICLFTFITVTSAFCQTKKELPDSLKIIRGQVIDNKSGEIFPLVLVTLFFTDKEYKSVRCDFDGKFTLRFPKSKLTEKSNLEFISFNYKPTIVRGNIDKIKNLTIELEFDSTGKITKDYYNKLCEERYDYANECGTKDR